VDVLGPAAIFPIRLGLEDALRWHRQVKCALS
jgi:hypothetical protein